MGRKDNSTKDFKKAVNAAARWLCGGCEPQQAGLLGALWTSPRGRSAELASPSQGRGRVNGTKSVLGPVLSDSLAHRIPR
jgi:hypothetical protein